jgi:hypothetical protein
MDILFDLLLMAHLLSLLAAGGVVIAIPLIAGRIPVAAPELRPVLGGIAGQIGLVSRIAFAVLIVSGPLMVWLRFGGVAALGNWFWIKMALIVVMAAGMGANGLLRRQGRFTEAGLAANVSRLALVGVVVAAVLAFN